jgi:hypothetical protein
MKGTKIKHIYDLTKLIETQVKIATAQKTEVSI